MSDLQSDTAFVQQCRSFLEQIEATDSPAAKIRLLHAWADYMAQIPRPCAARFDPKLAAAGKDAD